MSGDMGRWLVTAACLVTAGAAVFCAAMAADGWDFARLAGLQERTVEITGDFRDISVLSDTEDIAFRPSEDGKCRVVFLEREKERHTAAVSSGTLAIRRQDDRKWYEHITFFSFGKTEITVWLPGSAYGALLLEGKTGDVSIPEGFSFDSADIGAGTGSVDFRADAGGSLRIRTGTGDIRLEDLTAGELDLRVTTGDVRVRSVSCGGGVNLSVTTGRTELADVSCRSLYSRGDTGSIALADVIAGESISIERSTGSVTFESCDAKEVRVKTKTGDVTGSFLSAKVFDARSETGRVDVPAGDTGGRCEISTATGSIRIGIAAR